jgi:hypothetical protein
MKLVKKNTKADPELRDDPRPKDTVMWNRLRLMVEEEACDRAWGCALYRLHRTGWITTEHREAGDEYQRIVQKMNCFPGESKGLRVGIGKRLVFSVSVGMWWIGLSFRTIT